MDPLTASIALTVGAGVTKGVGGFIQGQASAEQKSIAAKAGAVRAEQTDQGYREELNRQLGTIRAIRASANTSGTSPTAVALAARERKTSETNRRRRVQDIENQIEQDKIDRDLFRLSSGIALGTSIFETGASAFGKL